MSAAGERGLEREGGAFGDELRDPLQRELPGLDRGEADVRGRHPLRHQVGIDVFDGTREVRQVTKRKRGFPGTVRPRDDMAHWLMDFWLHSL